jgi:hypothetical protein
MATPKIYGPLADVGFSAAAAKPKPKTIAELKADIAATQKIAEAAVAKAEASVVKMDPAYGVDLAKQVLAAAKPGSAEYTAALRAKTLAQTNLDQTNAVKPQLDAVSQARGDTYSWDTANKKWNVIKGPNQVSTTWDSVNNKWVISSGGIGGSGTPPGGGTGGGTPPGSGNLNTGLDSATQNLINSLQQQVASLTAAQNNTATTNAAVQESARQDALAALTDRFAKFGLTSLVSKIKELAITGASEATISLQLQETPEYKQRFNANEIRLKKGLTVLAPSEYLANEDRYRQALRAYGLTQFDNDAYVSQFIANDVSPTELSNRIVTAVQRVQNADPAVAKQLKDYYNIGQTDLVAYVLDPEQQFQKIERQVAAAEIGVAAGRQGLQAGVGVAEQLAAQGVTQAEAQKGYATIADILPTAEKLSGIYGTTLEGYNQASAEQEVFNSLASAQRARQKLTAREVAEFGSSSGMGRTSLANTRTAGQI